MAETPLEKLERVLRDAKKLELAERRLKLKEQEAMDRNEFAERLLKLKEQEAMNRKKLAERRLKLKEQVVAQRRIRNENVANRKKIADDAAERRAAKDRARVANNQLVSCRVACPHDCLPDFRNYVFQLAQSKIPDVTREAVTKPHLRCTMEGSRIGVYTFGCAPGDQMELIEMGNRYCGPFRVTEKEILTANEERNARFLKMGEDEAMNNGQPEGDPR